MYIQTARLDIRPLNRQELELYLAEDNLFEQAQQLCTGNRQLNEELKNLIKQYYLPALLTVKPEHHPYYTVWIAIDRRLQQVVAEFGFKGAPVNRTVEIGYDTFPAFRRQGYITEVVRGAIQWLRISEEVDILTAETLHSNIASVKVLEKCGFAYSHREKTLLYWKKTLR
jgi:RimJ/RimL family protein N-acetyltransferase